MLGMISNAVLYRSQEKHEHLGLVKILLEHKRSFLGYTGDCD